VISAIALANTSSPTASASKLTYGGGEETVIERLSTKLKQQRYDEPLTQPEVF
jgi:hypothetical protein